MNRTAILSDYVTETESLAFEWGKSDSVMWLAGAVDRLTGVDHAAKYRGRYHSCAAGRRILRKSLLRFIGERFDALDHPVRAIDGDIGALKQGREWVFGIFIGAHLYMQTADGIGILPRGDALKAFRVP